MTDPSDLRELAYRLELILEREPSDLRAALIRAVASELRAKADELRQAPLQGIHSRSIAD